MNTQEESKITLKQQWEQDKALRVQAAVCEEMEQRRRCLDLGGEALKRSIAQEVSKLIPRNAAMKHVPPPVERCFLIIEESTEEIDLEVGTPSILTQGWSALKHAAEAVTQATVDAMEKVGNKTASMVESFVDKTSVVAESVGHKTSDAVEQIVDKTSHMASQVAHTTGDVAHSTADLGHQLAERTGDAASHLARTLSDAAHTTSDTAVQLGHKTGEAAAHLVHTISDAAPKVSEAAIHLGHDVASYVGHKFEEAVDKVKEIREDSTKLYIIAQEKAEQARRMASAEEQCAFLNAMAVSALIANLDISFYKQSVMCKWYRVKLLESMEVKWRLFHELDGYAVSNAKKEALLIKQHFASKTKVESRLPLKVAIVVPVSKNAPYTAAQ